jgi:type III secretion protein J
MGRSVSPLAAGCLLAALTGCCLLGCSAEVARGLEESEANRVVVALAETQIAASKHADPGNEGRFLIEVTQADLGPALAALDAAGLPTQRNPGVLDALGESGLVASPSNEHARQVIGVAGELERSLLSLESVLSARVHLAVPETGQLTFEPSKQAASASVLIRHRGASPPIAASEIARLVAGAVPGLAAEAVVVILHPVATLPQAQSSGLSAFGPLTVGRGSVSTLRWVLGGAALLNVMLVLAVCLLWVRIRSLNQAETKGSTEAI